ncbi:MAG: twitching motility protein PilT [Nitrospirae bacterium RBG_13_43_8]|nr:MAG: twitching motility protein PilT [Nitrospirae bacterium RBG_13_43_8]
MILVDTSVLIHFFKGADSQSSRKFKMVLERGIPFGINPLIFQEVLQGAGSEKEYLTLKKYLETQRFYHLMEPIDSFAQAAKIYLDCRKKGITIRSTIDCLIAQTALENDLLLLHEDNDFDLMAKVIPLKFFN